MKISSKTSIYKFSVALIILIGFWKPAISQELNCENLKLITNNADFDPTFKYLTGKAMENKPGEPKTYAGVAKIWKDEQDMLQTQFVSQNENKHLFIYNATYDDPSTGQEANDEVKKIASMFKDCLGDDWILKLNSEPIFSKSNQDVFYIKNVKNYVVVKIFSFLSVHVEIYNDRKNSKPDCLFGDCDSFLGTAHFFNEDTYSGTFIDGAMNGMGRINWYATKTSYQGSFINNEVAGFGNIYNEKGEVIQSGLFFNCQIVKPDTSQKGCQCGDCQNGFGLKVVEGSYYIGNFKNGQYEGLGETATNKKIIYAYYKNNTQEGKGIIINSNGEYIFANFTGGELTDKYQTIYPDKTSCEASINNQSLSFFDENNILQKSKVSVQNKFIEKTDSHYLSSLACAQSLKEFYSYRHSGYKEIKGEQDKLLKNLGFLGGYKSTLLFQKLYEVSIDVDNKNYYFITVNLSGKVTDKLKWGSLFNKYYDILNEAVGFEWKAITDEGKTTFKKHSSNYILQNIFDRSKTLNLSIDQNGVNLEIH